MKQNEWWKTISNTFPFVVKMTIIAIHKFSNKAAQNKKAIEQQKIDWINIYCNI